ncbi:MAG: hypothetical protein K2I21_05185 [Acetatifactor sp.]|nr:hypothetical protein [Acetatifactor sp.]
MGYGEMNAFDWENACDNIRNNNAVANLYKEDAKKARQKLSGSQFWGIADKYCVRSIIEELFR